MAGLQDLALVKRSRNMYAHKAQTNSFKFIKSLKENQRLSSISVLCFFREFAVTSSIIR